MMDASTVLPVGADSTGSQSGPRLQIPVRSAFGRGPTKLAAFDAALRGAHIANFNLLALSSVIPPGSTVWHSPGPEVRASHRGGWGDRLYVVMADQRTDVEGDEAWAGIGWVQSADGRGLFVEHHGATESTLRNDIEMSLAALVEGRDVQFSAPRMAVNGGVCDGEPVCALVVAVYQAEPWCADTATE